MYSCVYYGELMDAQSTFPKLIAFAEPIARESCMLPRLHAGFWAPPAPVAPDVIGREYTERYIAAAFWVAKLRLPASVH